MYMIYCVPYRTMGVLFHFVFKLFLWRGFQYQLRSRFCFRFPFIWEVSPFFSPQRSIVLRYSFMFPLTVLLIDCNDIEVLHSNLSVMLCSFEKNLCLSRGKRWPLIFFSPFFPPLELIRMCVLSLWFFLVEVWITSGYHELFRISSFNVTALPVSVV